MVGVAGKSQACNWCRERRIKCDLRRPSCLKCIKAKRACTGYDRDLVFVNRTHANPLTTAPGVFSSRKNRHTGCRSPIPSNVVANLEHLFSESAQNIRAFRRYASELLRATYLPRRCHLGTQAKMPCLDWVYSLDGLTGPSRALDASLYAFCLTQLHISENGSVSPYQGLPQYTAALQHLHSDLGDGQRQFREETLAAILILSTCELYLSPGGDGWTTHAKGIAEIIRLRDPGRPTTPVWQHIFSRMRIVCVIEAMTRRDSQGLGHGMWPELHSKSDPDNPVDSMIRMFAGFPTALEQAASLSQIQDLGDLVGEAARLSQSLRAMVRSVELWEAGYEEASARPRYRLVPCRATNPADSDPTGKMFTQSLDFESLTTALCFIMCWAVRTQLCSNVVQVHDLVGARIGTDYSGWTSVGANSASVCPRGSPQHGSAEGFADDLASVHKARISGTSTARQVCQSMEYFHQTELGTYSGHSTTYPAWSARQYFRLHGGHERELLWLQNLGQMKGPGTRWGLSAMTFPDIVEPLAGWEWSRHENGVDATTALGQRLTQG